MENPFLLQDVLEVEVAELKEVEIWTEVGSGCGVGFAFLASVTGPQALYVCTDTNLIAAARTLATACYNELAVSP